MRPRFTAVALAAVVALTVACNGESPTSPSQAFPTPPPGTFTTVTLSRGSMRAVVDGVTWEATTPFGGTTIGPSGVPGVMTVSGLALGPTPFAPGLFVSLTAPLAAGTYTLNPTTLVTFSLMDGLSLRWAADPFRSGSSGTLTLTSATTTRMTGTFSFTAVATSAGMSPQQRVVTNGTFDLSQ